MSEYSNPSNPEWIVEERLHSMISEIERFFDARAISFVGGFLNGIEDIFRDHIEFLASSKGRGRRLVVIIETYGGLIEVVERIVNLMRYQFREVDFIVPNYAMSAGTVLVMSGNEIYMDYSSILGPIDPQIGAVNGRQVPALGYLEQYKRLIDKANNGMLNTAELAILIEKFDQAEMYRFEQARELSITLLKDWLARYKFKGWKYTSTEKKKVTDGMRKKRAEEIAVMLSDPSVWHSHSRGITMQQLREDVKLKIEDFGSDPEKSGAVRAYCGLLRDYMIRRQQRAVLHRREGYVAIH